MSFSDIQFPFRRAGRFVAAMLALAGGCLFAPMTRAADPVELVPPSFFKRDLCLVPDGSGVVFAETVSAANLQLKLLKFADGSVSLFQKTGREISFSADGNVVAHTQGDGLGCQVEVHDRKRDTKLSIRSGFVSAPAVSPDGRYVVVVLEFGLLHLVDLNVVETTAGKRNANQIEIKKDPKSNTMLPPGVRRLTPDGIQGDYAPSFSPDGATIAFASRRDNDFEIYAMKIDGSEVVRLTKSPGIDNQPTFSPDGKRIAFTSNRDLNYEIYAMNADGSNVRRVTNHPERDDFACWSKDGRHILFVGERDGKFGVYRVAAP